MNVDDLAALAAEIKVSTDAGGIDFRGNHHPLSSEKTLHADLTSFIYSVVHAGVEPEDPHRELRLADFSGGFSLSEVIQTATPHRHTLEPVEVQTRGEERTVVITGHSVRISVRNEDLIEDGSGCMARLPASRPGLSPGFHLVKGSRGVATDSHLMRVYVNIATVDRLGDVWRTVLEMLESRGVRYHAKAVSDQRSFDRRDSMVVYLGPDADVLTDLAIAVSSNPIAKEALAPDLSPFVYQLLPGLGVAFEPADPRARFAGRSLGEHRSGCVAAAVAESIRSGTSVSDELPAVLAAANVDPEAVWRNADSPALAWGSVS